MKRAGSSAWRVVRALLTLVAVATVAILVPVFLVVVAGVPVPRPFSAHSVLGARGLFDLIIVALWVLWALQIWVIGRATVAVMRRGTSAGPNGPIERLAVRLAGACLVIGALWSGSALLATTAGALAMSPPPVPSAVVLAGAAPRAVRDGSEVPEGPRDSVPTVSTTSLPTAAVPAGAVAVVATPSTVTVAPGDSLWSIAEHLYGVGADWQLLSSANLGHVMAGGMRFTTPNLIYPGWELVAPALDATSSLNPPPSPVAVKAPKQDDIGPPGPAPSAGASSADAPPPREIDPDAVTPVPTKRGVKEAKASTSGPGHHERGAMLPELAALGVGALGAAVLARRIHWLGLWSRIDRRSGQVTVPLSQSAQAVAEDLGTMAGSPAPSVLTAALSHLTYAIRAEGTDVPRIRLVRVGPDGVALILAEERSEAPGAFQVAASGMAWVLPAALEVEGLPGARGGEVWLPALVPVGDDSAGTYLVPVEPGETLAVVGPHAEAALAAIRAVAGAWEWAEYQLQVIDDPMVAAAEAGLVETEATCERIRLLYLGDADELDILTRAKVGVVSGDVQAATDAVAVCQGDVTRLQPFGLTLVPAGLDTERAGAVDELLLSAGAGPVDPVNPVDPMGDGVKGDPERTTAGWVGCPPPGPREARVLTPVPRIDGDMGNGPAGRLPRLVELFCYLALAGHPVPPDELLMEALAAKDDAAPGTLRNVATRLRSWVGADYFPSAKGAGYRVSDEVTTDLGRLQEAVRLARKCDDEDERIALLRPALELIEGPPTRGTRSGWGWWTLYDAQARDAASDAAQILAPALAARGDRQGARWAIEQARLVEDCSEALYRVAMECGGLVGDAGWVERELRAWEQKMDELFPGATPTDETYATYRTVMAGFGVPA